MNCNACMHKPVCEGNKLARTFLWSSELAKYLRQDVHTSEIEQFMGERCIFFLAKKILLLEDSGPETEKLE